MTLQFTNSKLKLKPHLLLNLFSSPSSLLKLAKSTHLFVKNKIATNSNSNKLEEMVECLDEISNRMCIVTDSAECIRRLHPERKWRIAADHSFNLICSLMIELNSNHELSKHFKQLENKPRDRLDPETEAVIKSFKRDFDNYKNISKEERIQLMTLEQSVDKAAIEFETLASRGDTSKSSAIASLENLIRSRFFLAKAIGKSNPLEVLLSDKQLSTSDNVYKFLKKRWIELHEPESFQDRQVFEFTNLKRLIDFLCRLTRELFDVEVKISKDLDFIGNTTLKLKVIRSNDLIGTILLDLGVRKFKDKHPVHYTIQCRKHQFQPAIILISAWIEDFQRITWQQSQSLFHEFGHALHSVLSETKYQVLSGTRGPVDLAEIPSTLFELIHDSKYVQKELNSKGVDFVNVTGKKILNETEFQLQLAALDQLIHYTTPGPDGWTRHLVAQVQKEFPLTSGNKKGLEWHAEIGHLSTYGGTYFAYNFSKQVAENIWTSIFHENCFESRAGGIFLAEFLTKGGTANLDFIENTQTEYINI